MYARKAKLKITRSNRCSDIKSNTKWRRGVRCDVLHFLVNSVIPTVKVTPPIKLLIPTKGFSSPQIFDYLLRT